MICHKVDQVDDWKEFLSSNHKNLKDISKLAELCITCEDLKNIYTSKTNVEPSLTPDLSKYKKVPFWIDSQNNSIPDISKLEIQALGDFTKAKKKDFA